jgi:hypothetical protein
VSMQHAWNCHSIWNFTNTQLFFRDSPRSCNRQSLLTDGFISSIPHSFPSFFSPWSVW